METDEIKELSWWKLMNYSKTWNLLVKKNILWIIDKQCVFFILCFNIILIKSVTVSDYTKEKL